MDDVTSHILHSSENTLAGLSLTFKRYRPPASATKRSGATRVALVFAHCVGTHKETWVPVIEYLYQFQSSASCSTIIAEAWSMDSPNHGAAAAINERALLERPQGITGYDWARGFQTLLKSGLISSDKVVSIGHSAGACVMVLSTIPYPLHDLPYSSMILIEPTMLTKELMAEAFKQLSEVTRVSDAVKTRRDIWESREIARSWFAKRLPWKRWDSRILDAFIGYGLRDLPTASYPDRANGVTLSCTREQEAVSYIYHQDGVDGNECLSDLCPRIPVHCVFGSEIDLVPDEIHRGVYNGCSMASITRIQGSGHLVTQEAPFQLAQAIWKALNHDYANQNNFKL
ncbi:alpha/beta-hydrolase [Mycena sanguinolenta]|nr:alpha/beta-hydrolase [Mycena sanguinolenta]